MSCSSSSSVFDSESLNNDNDEVQYFVSSPQLANDPPDFSVSAIANEPILESDDPASEESFQTHTKLFSGSTVTMEDSLTLIEQFSSRFNLYDEGLIVLHSLVKRTLPRDNILPSGYTTIRKNKQNFDNKLRVLEKSADNSICILKFCSQLIRIVEKHLNSTLNYSKLRQQNKEVDFNPSFLSIENRK